MRGLVYLNQGFPNHGPRAIYSPFHLLIWPAKQFILIITSFNSISFNWKFKEFIKIKRAVCAILARLPKFRKKLAHNIQ